jgi:aryl-alcohol dehydrogenase-like predicted oxidoreductase
VRFLFSRLTTAPKFSLISQDETSEAFIGEWAEKRGIRDQLVIATKVLFTSFMYFEGR